MISVSVFLNSFIQWLNRIIHLSLDFNVQCSTVQQGSKKRSQKFYSNLVGKFTPNWFIGELQVNHTAAGSTIFATSARQAKCQGLLHKDGRTCLAACGNWQATAHEPAMHSVPLVSQHVPTRARYCRTGVRAKRSVQLQIRLRQLLASSYFHCNSLFTDTLAFFIPT